MTWLPGQTGNSHRNGHRPVRSRNRRTTDAIEAIIKAGHQDPLLTLAELQAKSTDEGIRATAANMLAPFLHSKCGAMPPLRFISEPVVLPNPNPTTEGEIRRQHRLSCSSPQGGSQPCAISSGAWVPVTPPISAFEVPAQPVDATQALNLSAGVSNCKVSRGRSFS